MGDDAQLPNQGFRITNLNSGVTVTTGSTALQTTPSQNNKDYDNKSTGQAGEPRRTQSQSNSHDSSQDTTPVEIVVEPIATTNSNNPLIDSSSTGGELLGVSGSRINHPRQLLAKAINLIEANRSSRRPGN